MESGNSSYTQLSVRISVKRKESLIGSGVLYLRNKNQDALIFTAAHVILDNTDDTGTVQLHMHIFDRNHESHEISGTFTKATNETPVRNNSIYVLETYERKKDKSDKEDYEKLQALLDSDAKQMSKHSFGISTDAFVKSNISVYKQDNDGNLILDDKIKTSYALPKKYKRKVKRLYKEQVR